MKIAYFPDAVALNGREPMAAVLESATAAGHTLIQNTLDADAAVIWSVLWAGRMAPNQAVYNHYRQQNKPVIVVEVGALHRGQTWKVSVNNVTAAGYYGHQQNLDWNRPCYLGIALQKPKANNPSIVIAAQHYRSLQVADISSPEQWVQDQIQALKQVTDRPIRVRPHPRSPMVLRELPPGVTVEQPVKIANTYDSYDFDFDCWAVVNYNSGPGIQAAIAGVRPVVNASSLAAPVGINIAEIEQSYTMDRQQWLVEICHTEYTVDELRRGTWLPRIQAAL